MTQPYVRHSAPPTSREALGDSTQAPSPARAAGGLQKSRPSSSSRRKPEQRRAHPEEPAGSKQASDHEQHGAPARGAAAGPETGRRAATPTSGHGAAPGHLRGPPEDGPRRAAARRERVKRAARRASAVQPKGRSAFSITRSFVPSRRPRLLTRAVRGPRRACPSTDAEVRVRAAAQALLPQEAAGGLRRAAQSYFSWCRAAASGRITEPTGATGEAPAGCAEADEQAYELGRGDGAAAAAAAARALPDPAGTSTGTCGATGSRQERLLHESGLGD